MWLGCFGGCPIPWWFAWWPSLFWLYLLLGVLVFASSGDYPDGLWEMFLEITLLLLFVYALPYVGGIFRYRQMKMLESRDSRVQWVFCPKPHGKAAGRCARCRC